MRSSEVEERGVGPTHPLDQRDPGTRGDGGVAADGGGVRQETVRVGGNIVSCEL